MKSLIVRSNWLQNQALRLDASTYASGGYRVADRIRSQSSEIYPLVDIACCKKAGRFTRLHVTQCRYGTPLLSSSDTLLADLQSIPLIANTELSQRPDLILQHGWTLVSRSGTVGRTAYVRSEMAGMAATEHVMRVISTSERVRPGYLFAFLSTKHAQQMLQQNAYGTTVKHIEPHHLSDLPVPLPEDSVQIEVHNLVHGAGELRTEARRLLDHASGGFHSQINTLNTPYEHSLAVGVITQSKMDGRLDAFHNVGWAAESDGLSGDRIDQLAEILSTARVPRTYAEQGVPFLSGIDVFQARPSVRVRLARHVAKDFDAFVRQGDLAVQGSGQRYGLLGRAAFVGKYMHGWAASHDLFRIRTGNERVTARIYAFLRSDVGRRAMLRHSYGTSIPHVNPRGIAAVVVPNLPEHLENSALEALRLRELAIEHEEQAIRMVERWLSF